MHTIRLPHPFVDAELQPNLPMLFFLDLEGLFHFGNGVGGWLVFVFVFVFVLVGSTVTECGLCVYFFRVHDVHVQVHVHIHVVFGIGICINDGVQCGVRQCQFIRRGMNTILWRIRLPLALVVCVVVCGSSPT